MLASKQGNLAVFFHQSEVSPQQLPSSPQRARCSIPLTPFCWGAILVPCGQRDAGGDRVSPLASDFHLASTSTSGRSLNFQGGGGGKVLLCSTLLQICSLHPSPINPFRSIPSSSIFPLQRASHSTSKSFCCHPFLLPLHFLQCPSPRFQTTNGQGEKPCLSTIFRHKAFTCCPPSRKLLRTSTSEPNHNQCAKF